MRTFDRRIYLGIILFVVGFIPLLVGSFFALNKVVTEQRAIITTSVQQLSMAERLRFLDSVGTSLMPVYILSGDDELIKNLDLRNKEFDDVLKEFSKFENSPDEVSLLANIQALSLELRALAQPGIVLKQKGHSSFEVSKYFQKNSNALSEELNSSLKQLLTKEVQDLDEAQLHHKKTVTWVINSLIVLFCFALGLGLLASRLMLRVVKQQRVYDEAQKQLFIQERKISLARKEAVEVVSHDLRNPLGAIKMSLEMMLDQASNGESVPLEKLQAGLHIARRSADSMSMLIEDLLDHTKIEAGNLVLDKSDCDLGLLISEFGKRFALQADQKNISLVTKVSDANPNLKCDIRRIEQVISNLIGNAIKFTPAHGAVSVTLAGSEKNLLISVEDTGPGMDPAHLSHIFERFWQVRKASSQGTGLGLTIAKSIVDAHGGNIWAESELGKGSTFFVSLPRLGVAQPKYAMNDRPIEI